MLYGKVGLASGASGAVAEPMFELTFASADKVAFEIGKSEGLVLATLPRPIVVGVMPFTVPYKLEVPLTLIPFQTAILYGKVGLTSGAKGAVADPMFELTFARADKVALDIGKSDGFVLATFPNPKLLGVIALTDAAEAK